MNREEIIEWLLAGDVSIQYRTHRDLLHSKPEIIEPLKERIAKEGWGLEFLKRQHSDGHWGRAFYQPKWTSTNYTLIDLKNLGIPGNPMILKAINDIADTCKGEDGGINGSVTIKQSDLCIDGMFLNYACYFKIDQEKIMSVVDFIVSQKMADGGFNCRLNRYGARHSSMHTTINVLEGIREYISHGYDYRRDELLLIERQAQEFLLMHHLFKSDRTGQIIDRGMVKLAFPCRWHYDILRSLEYFKDAKAPYDSRMQDALDIVIKKQDPDGRWRLPYPYKGSAVHFEMEQPGQPSRWNTLRAMGVLEYFNQKPGRTTTDSA